MTKNQKPKYQCDICEEEFTTKEDFFNHLKKEIKYWSDERLHGRDFMEQQLEVILGQLAEIFCQQRFDKEFNKEVGKYVHEIDKYLNGNPR